MKAGRVAHLPNYSKKLRRRNGGWRPIAEVIRLLHVWCRLDRRYWWKGGCTSRFFVSTAATVYPAQPRCFTHFVLFVKVFMSWRFDSLEYTTGFLVKYACAFAGPLWGRLFGFCPAVGC